jgi:hypothetical protein
MVGSASTARRWYASVSRLLLHPRCTGSTTDPGLGLRRISVCRGSGCCRGLLPGQVG